MTTDRMSESKTISFSIVSEIHFAAQFGDIDTIKTYFDDGGDIDQSNGEQQTALYLAVEHQQWAVVAFLLANNADPFYPGSEHDTFLHHALRKIDSLERLSAYWQCFSASQQQTLLQTINKEGYLPLHEIAAHGQVEFIHWLMAAAKNKVSINWDAPTTGASPGYMPLQLAGAAKHMQMISALLRQGADPFALNETIEQSTLIEQAQFLGLFTEITQDTHHSYPLVQLFINFLTLRKTTVAIKDPTTLSLLKDEKSFSPTDTLFSETDSLPEPLQSTEQAYFKLLKQLFPEQIGICPILLALSDLYLKAGDHLSAMRYAAGAFHYYPTYLASNLLTSTQQYCANTIDRILEHYLQTVCELSEPTEIRSGWFTPWESLKEHRLHSSHTLPGYPSPKASQVFSWLKMNSLFFKQWIATAFTEALTLCGKPPCTYALIGLGSLARDEMCPYSDLEYALLLEKTTPAIRDYFQKAITLMQLSFVALGEMYLAVDTRQDKLQLTRKGFHPDQEFNPLREGLMGTIAELTAIQQQDVSDQRIYVHQSAWLRQHMLLTVCFITGDATLVQRYQETLRSRLTTSISTSFWPLSSKTQAQQRALMGLQFNMDHLLPTIHRDKKLTDPLQIKQDLCCLPLQWIGYLTLYYGIENTSSYERLYALHRRKRISDAGLRHLTHLTSHALHLRVMAQQHYHEERDDAWFREDSLLLDSQQYDFILSPPDEIQALFNISLSLEAVLKQFVHRQGQLDLRTCRFYSHDKDIEAQIYVSYRDFFTAEKLFQALNKHISDDLATYVKWINFYASWYDTQHHEWEFLQSRGKDWARQLGKIMIQRKVPDAYCLMHYVLLPPDCRLSFLEAIQQMPLVDETDKLCQEAIVDHIRQYDPILHQQNPHKKRQMALTKRAETYWQTQCEKANEMIDLIKESKALQRIYRPKPQEIGLDHDQREQSSAEHRLAIFHRYLQRHHLTLESQEILYISLIHHLKKIEPLQQKKAKTALEKLETKLMELIQDWQAKTAPQASYVSVYQQLASTTRKLFREKLLDYHDQQTQKPSDQQFLLELLTLLNRYPDEDGQRADWLAHKQRWQMTLVSLVDSYASDSNVTLASPLLFQTYAMSKPESKSLPSSSQPLLKSYPLKSDIAKGLIHDDKFIEHKIKASQSNIIALTISLNLSKQKTVSHTTTEQTIYCKEKPEMPGMSYLIELLHHQIIGHGTSLSELVCIHVKDKPAIPVLISEGIAGENLDDILLTCPEKLSHLSHRHFSELALMAMLTNPGDGKPANYILITLENGEYTLVSVDHDHALFPAYLIEPPDEKESKDTQPQLQVRSILFCLEAMHQPIHPEASQHFCQLDTFQVLRQVLQQAQVQNEYYQQLLSTTEITALHKQGHSTIPIPIRKDDIIHLYQKMCRLQSYLHRYPQATLLQCLLQAEPRVGLAYQQALSEPESPRNRLEKIGRYRCDTTGHQLTSTRALFSRTLTSSFLSKTEYLQLESFSPEEGLAVLDKLSRQHRHLIAIQAEVQQGEFRRFTDILSMQDREIILCGDHPDDDSSTEKTGLKPLRWEKLPTKAQQALLDLLVKKPWQRLYLSDCHTLTPSILYQLLQISPELQELHIDGYPGSEVNQLAVLLNKHPTLHILYVRRTPQLTALQNLNLPVLDTLVIEHSPKLQTISMVAPQLRVLRAKNCPQLTHIVTGSYLLTYLDCQENNILQIKDLTQVAENYTYLITLKLAETFQPQKLSQFPWLLDFLSKLPRFQEIPILQCLVNLLDQNNISIDSLSLFPSQKQRLYWGLVVAATLEKLFRMKLASLESQSASDLEKVEGIKDIIRFMPYVPLKHIILKQLISLTRFENSKWVRERAIDQYTHAMQMQATPITLDHLNPLIELEKDTELDIRKAAITAFTAAAIHIQSDSERLKSLKQLLTYLEDENPMIHKAAVAGFIAMIRVKPCATTTACRYQQTESPEDDIRWNILQVALARVGTEIESKLSSVKFNLPQLIVFWKDKSWVVRETAIITFSVILETQLDIITLDHLTQLIELMADEYAYVSKAALKTLIGIIEAKPSLVTLELLDALMAFGKDSHLDTMQQAFVSAIHIKPALAQPHHIIQLINIYKSEFGKNGLASAFILLGAVKMLEEIPSLITPLLLQKLLEFIADNSEDTAGCELGVITFAMAMSD